MSIAPSLFYATLLALALPMAVLAQQAQPEKKAEPEVAEEVIVTAPRNGEPDFQEAQEFHDKEYQRLHAKFGKEPPEQPRGDRTMGSNVPSPTSGLRGQIDSAPTLRETFGDK